MADLFTAAQLTDFTGRPVTDSVADTIHTWVLAVIESEIGALPTTIPPGVTVVAWELAKAAVPTPGGAAQATIGPYSVGYTAQSAGDVLSPDQRRRLHRAVDDGGGRAFSIDTGCGPGVVTPWWWRQPWP